ncbi:MAG: F0F1 ATP synthase subunit B' [Cyanobacteria bacterium M5B4]|nr:MAG: F0F1 ATP synthase subunit B' [Cyanobacteria bacterium M5B4]
MSFQPILLAVEVTEKSGGLFDFDATLPIMAIQFLLLVAILNSTFFQPLLQTIDSRNDYIRDTNNDAKARLAQAEQLALDYERETAETRKTAQIMIETAQAEANRIKAEAIAQANLEAQAQIAAAKATIEEQKAIAFAQLEGEVSGLSRQILERLVGTV